MLDEILQETEPEIHFRFSALMVFTFVSYGLFYYSLMPKMTPKPDFIKLIGLISFHIAHILGVKYLHVQGKYIYAWALVIVPIIVFQAYKKYSERSEKIKREEYAALVAQVKAEYGNENVELVHERPTSMSMGPKIKGDEYMQREMMPSAGMPMMQGQQGLGQPTFAQQQYMQQDDMMQIQQFQQHQSQYSQPMGGGGTMLNDLPSDPYESSYQMY